MSIRVKQEVYEDFDYDFEKMVIGLYKLIEQPLPNYNQIVGHTFVNDIEIVNIPYNNKLIFCDCLQKKTACHFTNIKSGKNKI